MVQPSESEEERKFLDAYEKGLKMISVGNWITAGELLDEALAIHRDRAARYAAEPPEDWEDAEELSFM